MSRKQAFEKKKKRTRASFMAKCEVPVNWKPSTAWLVQAGKQWGHVRPLSLIHSQTINQCVLTFNLTIVCHRLSKTIGNTRHSQMWWSYFRSPKGKRDGGKRNIIICMLRDQIINNISVVTKTSQKLATKMKNEKCQKHSETWTSAISYPFLKSENLYLQPFIFFFPCLVWLLPDIRVHKRYF